jgi:alpha-1,6-mannosyltransferase
VDSVRAVGLGIDKSIFRMSGDTARPDSLGPEPSTSTTTLLYVGRLAAEKNVAVLFDAFAELKRRKRHEFKLVTIGDGPERALIKQLKSGYSDVTWLKYCDDPAGLARHYRAADIFVHPGVRETFGLAALESQACGTPVVGIAGTRMDEAILHDQTWWAVENSARALADAIEGAVTLDLRAIGAAASRAVHERFTWEAVFERLLCIYAEVCANYERAAQ